MKGHCIVFWPRTFGEITRVHKLGQNVSQGHSDGNHLASFAGILSNFAKPQTPRDFEVLTQDEIRLLPFEGSSYQSLFFTGLPNELSIFWHQYPDTFGEEFCRLRSFLSEAASYANVLTIVSFSLERYLAICRPLYVFPLSDLRRAAIVSSLCWAIAMLASIPHLLFTK